jgi:glyoxylate utilization-related uncharacterized protein
MSLTFIDTNKLPRSNAPDSGDFTEVLNKDLCGADNVVGTLHWLREKQHLDSRGDGKTHRLLYVMEGAGTITLDSKEYAVKKGAGVYLGPSESASIRQNGMEPLKLFRLTVAKAQI